MSMVERWMVERVLIGVSSIASGGFSGESGRNNKLVIMLKLVVSSLQYNKIQYNTIKYNTIQ